MTNIKKRTIYKIKWKRLGVLACALIILILSINIIVFIKNRLSTGSDVSKIRKNITINQIVDDALTKTIPPDSGISKFDPYWTYIKMSLIDVDMEAIMRINSDSIGYIEIEGTDFKYPIVDYKDGFYKNHTFSKKKNSNGWIYLDEANHLNELDTNNIIYGNKKHSGALLSKLNTLYSKKWQSDENNFIIKYYTNYYTTLFQIISVYKTKDEAHLKKDFKNEKEIDEFIEEALNKSEVKLKGDVKNTDKFLTLTTNSKGENIVVLAKLIKIKKEQ